MNASEFAQAHGVAFDWSAEGYFADADGWEHHLFTVTLAVDGRSESFTWRQGLGIDSDPDVGSVLDALASDAHAGGETFEDFAADFGYDVDSRKAYATWKACRKVRQQIRRLFGSVPFLDAE